MSDPLLPVIPNILEPRSLNLLAGASGLGKTALIASIVTAIRDGQPLFEEPTTPPPGIGYITTDRPWASAVQWFRLAGFEDIAHYSLVDDVGPGGFDLKQLHGGKHGPAQFEFCVQRLNLPPGSLIIVDPIALFLGGKLNDYTSVAIASIQIQRYLADNGYTVIGICHTSKLKADTQDRYARPQDRILGSGALLGYSWTQMYFMSPEEAGRDDGQYIFTWNPHHAPPAEFLIKRDMTTGLFDMNSAYRQITSYGAPNVEDDPEVAPRIRQARHLLRLDELLGLFPKDGGMVATAELVRRAQTLVTPISRATLFRCLGDLHEAGRIELSGRGCWRLASATPTGETPPRTH